MKGQPLLSETEAAKLLLSWAQPLADECWADGRRKAAMRYGRLVGLAADRLGELA